MTSQRRGSISKSSSFKQPKVNSVNITNTPHANSSNDTFRQHRRKRSAITEDRLVSLFLVMMAGWFLYARYQEAKVLYGSRQDSSSVLNNRREIRMDVYKGYSPTKLDIAATHNNNNSASQDAEMYPSADDDEISTSKYLRRRESGSGGFMPQELKELLVMGGVDKGPPPHHSTDKNRYREILHPQIALKKSSEIFDSTKVS